MLTKESKIEINDRLVLPSYENGMSDTQWQRIAEKIAKKYDDLTIEEILKEYDDQLNKLINKEKENKTMIGTMTREDKLFSMRGPELIKVADKLGVKVKCNKVRNKLVEAKADLIARILEAEAAAAAVEEKVEEIPANTLVETPENITAYVETEDQKEIKLEETKEVTPPTPKRGALIEWNGKAQNICAWADELGISANTLYGRIYKLGWTVEKAFTTKGRK